VLVLLHGILDVLLNVPAISFACISFIFLSSIVSYVSKLASLLRL